MEAVKLIVGLGNPGDEYRATRHNAGQWFVDALLQRFPSPAGLQNENKFKGLLGQTTIAGRAVRVLVPATYMNLSGQSVVAVANFYKIEPEEILVAHDELDIDPGSVRLKSGGGHGGHNGLRDIISCLGNRKDFGRLRIGIGHPGNAKQVTNFVLKKAPAAEHALIETAIGAALEQIDLIVCGDWQMAMNQLHGFDAAQPAAEKSTPAKPAIAAADTGSGGGDNAKPVKAATQGHSDQQND
ncbi:MAG: aminoacyl-tRNA hydrolase [Gammaproteobacteria bacterium]|nr:aminoacyl-tRNA hydrolase [Gammaproteobacteria bacterium]